MNHTKVFKHLPFSINSLRVIINGEIWLGGVTSLNDNQEGVFKLGQINSNPSIELLRLLYEKFKDPLSDEIVEARVRLASRNHDVFRRDFTMMLQDHVSNNFGISSFTYKNNHNLMWSHYSDSHKGFAIEFDKNLLIQPFVDSAGGFIQCRDINYCREIPTINIICEKDGVTMPNMFSIFYTKNMSWKYEQEFRIIGYKFESLIDSKYLKFDKACVRRIIFGERMPEKDREVIRKIILNDVSYNHIRFAEATKTSRWNKISIKRLPRG